MTAAVAHGGPESGLVLVRAAAGAGVGAGLRPGGKRRHRRGVQFPLHLGGAFLALDGVAEVDHFLFHAFVLRRILRREHTVLILMFVEEGLCLVPDLPALFAHRKDLVHKISLLYHRWVGVISSSRRLSWAAGTPGA